MVLRFVEVKSKRLVENNLSVRYWKLKVLLVLI